MGACATKPKAVDGTAPEVAPAEQPAPAEVTREVEAVVVVSFVQLFTTSNLLPHIIQSINY